MKLLDRYLVNAFLAPFIGCIGIFFFLVMMARFFEKMDIFNNYHAKAADILLYLFLSVPYWLNLVLPVATMLAVLFSLGALQQRGEITACRSAGISSARLYMPYFGIAVILSVVSMIGGLSFLPKCNLQMRKIYRVHIKKAQALSYRKDHIVVAGRDHRRFTIGWLDVDKNLMKDVIVDRFSNSLEWLETISAQQVRYENKAWTFVEGTARRYDPAHPGSFLEEPFRTRVLAIPEKPRDFIIEDKMPEDMTGHEILRRIDRLHWIGAPSHAEEVEFHLKTALPFANLIVVLLAIPFAIQTDRHQSRAQTFAYALALAFLYWGLTSVCQSFGTHGHIPGWFAAWTANVTFGAVSLWRWRKLI